MKNLTLEERRANILAQCQVSERLVCEAERKEITKISRTKWWQLSKKGSVPSPFKPGLGKSIWLLSDLLLWMYES
ncbi:helix-turn-helix transcriptional regulator [Marinomonas gallaica]|uniref:helix-turn-helix transcriptional regulator n=1 Tax=Marinomonas gallaica TaxID=1806667 RepID=UPI003A92A858